MALRCNFCFLTERERPLSSAVQAIQEDMLRVHREALEFLRQHGELEQPRTGRPRRSPLSGGEAMVGGTNPIEIIELRILLEPARPARGGTCLAFGNCSH